MSGEQFVSMYPQDSPYKIYKPSEWFSDKWNALDYGRGFDFARPFFEQFQELMLEAPRMGINIVNCENSDYCNYCSDNKDCYMDIAGEANRDCFFNLFVKYSKNVVDSTFVYHSELCYECINCYGCYSCQYSMYLENCSDCLYCYDLIGCKNCLFSSGLRNKQYFIFNERKSREEYEKYLRSLALGSFSQRSVLLDGWTKFKKEKAIFRAAYFFNCENCTGNDIKNSKNTFDSYNVLNCEDCRYLYDVLDAKDCQDLNYSLYKPELSYELISSLQMVRCAFSMASHYNNDCYYCDHIDHSSNLFGCIGLNHKQYCILNRQYSREEYEELAPRIIEHMKKGGEWGEFFPAQLSPHAYNETVACEYSFLNKEEVEASGWKWKDGVGGSAGKSEVDIPDDITDVADGLAGKALSCEASGKLYKIIPQELRFYKRLGLPVPRRSSNQRHLDRMALRTPRCLWQRNCGKCACTIESVYDPARSEKVYCEKCYPGSLS